MRKEIHVTKGQDGSWRVKQPSNQKASAVCETQANAKEVAKVIAQNQGLEMYVHGINGKIREKFSYGHDPFPPRG